MHQNAVINEGPVDSPVSPWPPDVKSQLEKTLMLGKIEGKRRREQQRIRWLDSITDTMDMNFLQTVGDSEGQGSLECCITWDQRVRDNLATEQQQHHHCLVLTLAFMLKA